MNGDNSISVSECIGLKPLSTTRGDVHVVMSNVIVKLFGIAYAWPIIVILLTDSTNTKNVPNANMRIKLWHKCVGN